MKCEICECRLLSDCQFINGKYYHNKCIEKLIEENQELKKQLECSQINEETYYLEIQDITKILGFSEDTIFDEVKQYASKLKKENEEYRRLGFKHLNDKCNELETQLSIKTLQLEEMKLSKRDYTQENILEMKLTLKENQQKEFIEYLESMLDNDRDIFSVVRVKDVLSKYKQIIGVSNENNKQ